jgi:hypothetical protein
MATQSSDQKLNILADNMQYAVHSLNAQGFSLLEFNETGMLVTKGKYTLHFSTTKHVDTFLEKYGRVLGSS